MSRAILLSLFAATAVVAGVPVTFSQGSPAKADEVNKNFNYLDSAVGKKASQASLDAVAEALKNKADASALSGKADQSKLDDLTKTVATKASQTDLSTKKDSAWIVSTINGKLPTGGLVAKNNLSELKDSAAKVRENLGLKSLATSDSVLWNKVSKVGAKASEVGALPSSAISGTLNSVPKFTGAGAIGNSGISDDGTMISLNPPNSSSFRFSQLVDGPGYGAIYGYTTPTASNFILKTTGDNSLTTLNGGTVSLASGGNTVLAANASGITVTGNLSSSGSISLPYYPHATSPDGIGNTILIGKTEDLNPGSGGYELAIALPKSASHWPFAIYKEGSQLFQVDNMGNTTIAGSITSTAGNWHVPDYVFEPDYKLASLSEVEAFTKANKHLPEVPSAAEIEQNGLDLAKMNLILLKKVEELTLHAIDLEKRLKAVEAKD